MVTKYLRGLVMLSFMSSMLSQRGLLASGLLERSIGRMGTSEKAGGPQEVEQPSQIFTSHLDLLHADMDSLRREYKWEDFLWSGSGDGPILDASDGGLAWEENTEGIGATNVIRVTKTHVLYKTVMTTIYPVEMTPSVVTSTLDGFSVTHSSESSSMFVLSDHASPGTDFLETMGITETKSSLFTIEATPSFPSIPEGTLSLNNRTVPSTDDDALLPGESNEIYWVKTIIRANESHLAPRKLFVDNMQMNLARVYASAFKRHLLTSLGITNHTDLNNSAQFLMMPLQLRKKRSATMLSQLSKNVTFRVEYLKYSANSSNQGVNPVHTAMNVTVHIFKMSQDDQMPPSKLIMNYVVYAEGSPIPATTAVQDLQFVSQNEMEEEIGYQLVSKAEALVSPDPPFSRKMINRASPWLFVAIATICIMLLMMVMIMFMVWKWKHNRLQDSIALRRPHSGTLRGTHTSALQGPTSRTAIDHRHEIKRSRPSSTSSRSNVSRRRSGHGRQHARPSSLTSSSSDSLMLKQPMQTETYEDEPEKQINLDNLNDTEQIDVESSENTHEKIDGSAKAAEEKSPSVRFSSEYMPEETVKEDSKRKAFGRSPEVANLEVREPTLKNKERSSSAKSVDRISYGNVEMGSEPIGRIERSEKSRTRVQKSATTSGGLRQIEKDRNIDEIHFENEKCVSEMMEEPPPSKRHIQVQTPRKMYKRKTKSPAKTLTTTRRYKSTGAADTSKRNRVPSPLISTESEEIVEIHHVDSSCGDASNPLVSMRKRFHQFLDDAFNVIGSGRREADERCKSARVSICHKMESQQPGPYSDRPWTTQLIREESLSRCRPTSATGMGPPKRAWTQSSLQSSRRIKSANSSDAKHISGRKDPSDDEGNGCDQVEVYDTISTPYDVNSKSKSEVDVLDIVNQTTNPSMSFPSSAQFFPNYPLYPHIPFPTYPQSSNVERALTEDPAQPIIQSIRDEIKRFEKIVESESEHQ